MKKTTSNDKITNIKTNNNVFATPIQLIENPANKAPVTEAVFQVVVLQVAAL